MAVQTVFHSNPGYSSNQLEMACLTSPNWQKAGWRGSIMLYCDNRSWYFI